MSATMRCVVAAGSVLCVLDPITSSPAEHLIFGVSAITAEISLSSSLQPVMARLVVQSDTTAEKRKEDIPMIEIITFVLSLAGYICLFLYVDAREREELGIPHFKSEYPLPTSLRGPA